MDLLKHVDILEIITSFTLQVKISAMSSCCKVLGLSSLSKIDL